MVSVAPTSDPTRNLTNATLQLSCGTGWEVRGTKILRLWQRMQVSYYGGKYSIHRVLALDEYTYNTSPSRVLIVLVATPLPMIALVYGQELIPLQELTEGWSKNFGMWLRAAVLVGIVTHALLVQGTYLIDGFVVSMYQRLILYVWMPALVVSLSMAVAARLVFPIPFYILFITPPFYLLLVISLRIVVGSRAMNQMLVHRAQVTRCVRFVCAQTSTVFIFPVYEMLFRAAEGTKYQIPVVLLLPVIKVIIKNVVLHFAKSLEDMVPVEVIFTADFFNAVYVATCMQSASSAITISAITITDVSQTIIMLYGMQRRTSSILSRLCQTVNNDTEADNLLTMICSLCRNPDILQKHSCAGIRRRSRLASQLSFTSAHVLESLDGIFDETGGNSDKPQASYRSLAPQDFLATGGCFRSMCTLKRTNTVHPVVPRESMDSSSVNDNRPLKDESTSHGLSSSTILLEFLETLFTTECLVLAAYLEAFMPLFYCSYMLIMVHLRNAQYHTEMNGMTSETVGGTILPLFIFGLLQLVSFALLVVVIKHNCGMRALYQLAFVLVTQRSLIQCKMMLWMVITFAFVLYTLVSTSSLNLFDLDFLDSGPPIEIAAATRTGDKLYTGALSLPSYPTSAT